MMMMMMIQFDSVRNLKDLVTNGLVCRNLGTLQGAVEVEEGLHATVKDATRMIV